MAQIYDDFILLFKDLVDTRESFTKKYYGLRDALVDNKPKTIITLSGNLVNFRTQCIMEFPSQDLVAENGETIERSENKTSPYRTIPIALIYKEMQISKDDLQYVLAEKNKNPNVYREQLYDTMALAMAHLNSGGEKIEF